MNRLYTYIILIAISLTYTVCQPFSDDSEPTNSLSNTLFDADSDVSNDDPAYDKRVERYAFGLGRRAYTYTNGASAKRLPVYNFGLGKRAVPYSFGLGKRADFEEDQYMDDLESNNYDPYNYGNAGNKRSRPYSFGLGKRESRPERYAFGLGKREPKLDRYAFGLGKRDASSHNDRYSFGLGKREAPAQTGSRR